MVGVVGAKVGRKGRMGEGWIEGFLRFGDFIMEDQPVSRFNLIYFQEGMLVTKGIGKIRRLYYSFVNQLIRYRKLRWTGTLLLVASYIHIVQSASYDIATYLIGFYLLQLLISYFTPRGVSAGLQMEEQQQEQLYTFAEQIASESENATQSTFNLDHSNDKPLVRSLGEMQIWERATFAFMLGTICTYFKMIEIDVFWPLLLVYFVILVCYTIQKILKTMERYKYGVNDFQKIPL